MFNKFNLFVKKLDNINILFGIVNTLNPYSYLISKKDLNFRQALQSSDILLPDGIGIVWAYRLLNGLKIKKISGYDIFIYLMKEVNNKSGKVFFLGSTDETLRMIRNKAAIDFPNTKIETFSPSFCNEFPVDENNLIIKVINEFSPDVLFVGMTAPKQEKWVYKNKEKINVKTIASIGAVFDFYAGNVKRPPKFIIDLGLEWLFRLLQEPKRLWKRNFIYTPLFIIEVLKIKLFKS